MVFATTDFTLTDPSNFTVPYGAATTTEPAEPVTSSAGFVHAPPPPHVLVVTTTT